MISRFFFNITIFESIRYLFSILFFKKNNYQENLKDKLINYFPDSNFIFFDHGRTAFYEILSAIKKNTKKRKILINSLTLYEIINVIIYTGFIPEFVDTKENSFETDINLNKLNKNDIAAIVVTHLNGANKNINLLKEQIDLNNKNNDKIYLIEDCAVSLGSKINKVDTGNFGDFSFLSFNIMKNITSFTGGVLVNKKKNNINFDISSYKKPLKFNIFKKILFVLTIQLLNSKILFPFFFEIIKASHKYSFNFFLKKYRTDFEVKIEDKFPERFRNIMHDFQEYILLKQFDSLSLKQDLRIKKSETYYINLKKNNELYFPQSEFTNQNIFLDFPIICKTRNIQKMLFEFLLKNKIDVKNYYYTNCSEKEIYNKTNEICINSKKISENILMLPVHEKINKNYQEKIINKINEFFSENNLAD